VHEGIALISKYNVDDHYSPPTGGIGYPVPPVDIYLIFLKAHLFGQNIFTFKGKSLILHAIIFIIE